MDDVSLRLFRRFVAPISGTKDEDWDDVRAERVDIEEEGRDGGLDGASLVDLFVTARYFLIVGVRGATNLDVSVSTLLV